MSWLDSLVKSVRKGRKPKVTQIDPKKKDPVSGETAQEAFEKKQNGETPFVNPFHAKAMEEIRKEGEASK